MFFLYNEEELNLYTVTVGFISASADVIVVLLLLVVVVVVVGDVGVIQFILIVYRFTNQGIFFLSR